MTLEKISATAHGHFIVYQDNAAAAAVLRKYAEEQAELPAGDYSAFVNMMQRYIREEQNTKILKWFYLWYYINYVAKSQDAKRYTAEINVPDADDFTRTEISPVKLSVQDGKPLFIRCDPDDAAFWTVSLVSATGIRTLIADCLDQEAAQDIETLAYVIAANFKPEIWQKKK